MAESPPSRELYTCTSCALTIPPQLARVTCHSCPNHHLCANCHVIKAFMRPHAGSHSIMVFKQSGVVVPLPPGFAPRPPPALPPRPRANGGGGDDTGGQNGSGGWKELGKTKGGEPLGAANWGALWNIMKAPLEKKGKKEGKGSTSTDEREKVDEIIPKDVTGGVSSNFEETNRAEVASSSEGAALPPSPPRSIRKGIERVDSQAAITPSYPMPEKWESLFEENDTPTPIFIALMGTIFSRLDPEHTGLLSPETYSEFLEMQGCVESNVWKLALDRSPGEHSKEVADLELSLYFSDLIISHTLSVRAHTRQTITTSSDNHSVEEAQSAVEGKIRDSMRFNANMPMISRQGFIDVCAIEYLKDPEWAHGALVKVVRELGVWRALGDVPRGALPESGRKMVLEKDVENKTGISVTELMVQNDAENGEPKKEMVHDENQTVSAALEQASPEGRTAEARTTASGQILPEVGSRISKIPEPIEVDNTVTPIAIGSPALPLELNLGDIEIDVSKTKEELETVREEQAKVQEDSAETTQESAKIVDEKKGEVTKRTEDMSKGGESRSKKISVENLYDA